MAARNEDEDVGGEYFRSCPANSFEGEAEGKR